MKIPAEIFAGDSVTWRDVAANDNLGNEINSPDWTLKYGIKGNGANLVLTSSAYAGGGWSTAITATDSAALAAGTCFWSAWAEKGSERVTLATGQLEILANPATAGSTFDGRSQTEQDLDAVQAAMRAMISGGAVAEYTIGGRSLRKIPMTDLIQLESVLKSRLIRETRKNKLANGLGKSSNVAIRFKG